MISGRDHGNDAAFHVFHPFFQSDQIGLFSLPELVQFVWNRATKSGHSAFILREVLVEETRLVAVESVRGKAERSVFVQILLDQPLNLV